jgi:hypothetical protein
MPKEEEVLGRTNRILHGSHRKRHLAQLCVAAGTCLPNLRVATTVGTTDTDTVLLKLKTKLHGLSPRANYTDRATAACRRSDCQLLRIKGATWSA